MYLHHLIEEEDATWREPPGVIILTSLKIEKTLKTHHEKEPETNIRALQFCLRCQYSYKVSDHKNTQQFKEMDTRFLLEKCLTVIFL